VLELGAGSSGMAALCSYFKWKPHKVTITDGKLENLSSIEKTVQINSLVDTPIEVNELVWGDCKLNHKYELILAADCLFFEQYHKSLLGTLKQAMDQNSVAMLLNPKRGASMDRFLTLAVQTGFKSTVQLLNEVVNTEQYRTYSREIAQSEQYSP